MSISEQVKKLRLFAIEYNKYPFGGEVCGTDQILLQAVDTIEELSAKLDAKNKEIEQLNAISEVSNEIAENMKWILCKDKMPEVFDNVLVCTKEGGRAIAHRCPNQALGRYYDLHSSAIENVIAWRPLPEPYHEP